MNLSKTRDERFWKQWEKAGALGDRTSLEDRWKACSLFIAGKVNHTDALKAIGQHPDPSNKKIWGWLAEMEAKGIYKSGLLHPLKIEGENYGLNVL